MRHGNLFVISGPSGAGKGTLVARLLRAVPDAWVSVSVTTRVPRAGEVDGVHYHFATDAEFQHLVDEDGLLEWATYAGNRYGTPRAEVEERMAQGDQVVLEIDVQGALQVMQRRPDAISVFIAPPSYAELKRRLAGRGDTPPDIAARRLHIALEECRQAKHYQYTIINDSVGHAVQELEAVLTAEACRTSYRPLNLKEED